MVLITLVGMIGIYVGAIYTYQRYQAYKSQAGSLSGAASLLGGFLGGS